MRRARRYYAATILILCAATLVAVTIAWSRGEIAHTTLSPASRPAPPVALQAPSTLQRQAWTSRERPAAGTPYWGGTVITFSDHRVRGRTAGTGATTWSYTRTDRTVCQAIQDQGVTLAIFELAGNCDELTALDSRTGARRWTRTLDEDGATLSGHPTYSLTDTTIMITTPQVIYALDPVSGLDRWIYQPSRCTIDAATLGSAGALISQHCRPPPCPGLSHCASGVQLLLRDPLAARSDDPADRANPDHVIWRRDTAAVPLSVGRVLSVLNPAGNAIEVLAPDTGAVRAALPLRPSPPQATAPAPSRGSHSPSRAPVAALEDGRTVVVWIDGTAYALNAADGRLLWTRPTRGVPTAHPASPLIAALSSSGLMLLNPHTGQPTRRFAAASGAAAGSRAYQFGSGFVIAGRGTRLYR